MKILIVSSNTATSPYPVFPLGCGIIASALTNAGHKVEIFDIFAELANLPESDVFQLLKREALRFKPEMTGISIRNIDNVNILNEESFLVISRKTVKELRSVLPHIPIVLGGSGFSIMPERILEYTGADYGIVGEGEQLVLDLAASLSSGKYPPDKIIRSSGRGLSGNAIKGAMGFSAESAKKLTDCYISKGSIIPLQTKRGCLNNCVYCTYPYLEGKKLRLRDPGQVVDEMQHLHLEHGADIVFFTDSVFNDAGGEYLKIIAEMERKGVNIPWTAFFQPDPEMKDSTVKRLIATGLHSVELGPDASTDRTLKAIGKKFNFNDVVKCNKLFSKYHIAVANYFMMGGPGETRETAEEGVENIRNLDMSVSFVFLGIRILPGTPLYTMAIRQKIIQEKTDLLDPVYYFSPEIDRKWLEEYLDRTLGKIRHCVYPPNSMDTGIQILRKMGYRGNLWEMMIRDSIRLGKA